MINELENTSKRKDEIECIVENLYCYIGYKPFRANYNDFFVYILMILSEYINETYYFLKLSNSKWNETINAFNRSLIDQN